jgi:hypothetical protein
VSTISVDYDVLNQKGSPAWFSDTFANIPTAGYKGRMFISIDTYAFYRDTGTGWDLIGGPGTGTLTGSGATGQVSFFNGTQTITGNNNLFWDNTNSRLGINTTTPGAPLDIHGTGTQLQLNGTGANNSYLTFQNAGASKWRVGNLYNAGVNTFEIYNSATSSYALTIASATNNVVLQGSLTAVGNIETQSYLYINNSLGSNQIYLPKSSGDVYGTIQTEAGGNKFSLGNVSNIGTLGTPNITWTSGMQVGINNSSPTYDFDVTGTGRFTGILRLGSTLSNGTYFYTLPSATGTLALTSALSSYLPLAGGTLTGNLTINPTNTGITGLDVASNTTIIRSDNTEGFKRQLEITMSSGTLVQLTAKGYGANYGTDLAFYTATTGGTNTTPGIYLTGTNNRMGIGTGTPTARVSILGTGAANSIMTETCLSASNSNGILIGSDGTNALIGVNNSGTNMSFLSRVAGVYSKAMTIQSNGNVLINTTTDAGYKLQVYNDNIYVSDATSNNTVIASSAILLNSINSSDTASASAHLRIGDNTASRYWDISQGTAYDLRLYNFNGGWGARGSFQPNTGVYTPLSDINQKKDFELSIIGLDAILNLKPTLYRMKLENDTQKHLGFIAQEVKEFIPQAYTETGNFIGLNYNSITAALVKAIQELNEKLIRNNIN